MKTYLWMIATAISSKRRIVIKGKIIMNMEGIFCIIFLNRHKRRCPEIILAARRTAKVSGRIKLLIVSIKTINTESIIGVPLGTRCLNIWFVWFIHP